MNKEIKNNVRVLVADDHQLFRAGLINVLKKISFITDISQAENGEQVLELLKSKSHHVVLMDIKMPVMNGIEATKIIQKKYPKVKVIALTTFDDESLIYDMYDAGVASYLLKNTDKKEIEAAIRAAVIGEHFFSKQLSDIVLQKLGARKQPSTPFYGDDEITGKLLEVLRLICRQYSTREIANSLCMAEKTVEGYRKRLLEITDSQNTVGLAIYAVKNNLI